MKDTTFFFFISFIFIYFTFKFSAKPRLLASRASQYIQIKAFPRVIGHEHIKFSVIRIFFGLVLLFRSVEIHTYLLNEEIATSVGVLSVIYLASVFMLTVGLLTQLVLLFLIFFMWQTGDSILMTGTLGNDIAAMLSALLFLTGSGKYLSVDSILIKLHKKVEFFLLYIRGDVSPDVIALIKFSALASYWAVCVYSLSMHLNEPAWMDGTAGPLLLTNNFMSSWYSYFVSIFTLNEMLVFIAKCSLWLMMLWYPAILPCVFFGGIFRLYVIGWGLLFFSFSLIFLDLGSLAEIEFLFWGALFWSSCGISNKNKLLIFYDDKCNLCDKTIQLVCFLDVFSRVELKPLSENNKALKEYNIESNSAISDLYGVDVERNITEYGYDFYLLLAKKLVFLWPIYPFLFLGKLVGIGSLIYRIIADRRVALFGVCTVPSSKKVYFRNYSFPSLSNSRFPAFQIAVITHILFLMILYLVYIPAPYMGKSGARNMATSSAHIYGITPINVFNKTDLRMAENWFVIESLDFDELAPIFNDDGSRLEMHKSDRVYFGKTLNYRRKTIGKKGCFFEEMNKDLIYLSKIYLKLKNVEAGSYKFKYRQYHQALPNDDRLQKNIYKVNTINKPCEVIYTVDYES